MAFPTKYFLRRGRNYVHLAYENEHKTLETIQKVLENIYLIKILSTTKQEISEFRQTLRKYYSAVLNNFKFGAVNNITPNFVTIFILSVLISFYDFIKFITLEFIGVMLRLFQTLGTFNNTLNMVINSHVHLEKLDLLEKNKIKNKLDTYKVTNELSNESAIKLENVSFKYFGSENFLFKDINLNIKKGAHTVLTGSNGSGKSTLLGIISGILIPEEGKVFSSSNKLAYVGATPLIIKGTLKENLLYGNNLEITEDEIFTLLNAFKLFTDEKNSLDKAVTNKTLSSGQMQKVSFIRALLSHPDILILDESTSNLDLDSKNIINNYLDSLNLTIINSTHNNQETNYDIHYHIEIEGELRNIRLV